MKITFITAVIFFSSIQAFAAEQFFQPQSFDTLSLAKGMNVTVECGESNTIRVSGKSNLVDNLDWNVSSNHLTINNTAYHEDGFYLWPDKLDVTITTTTPLSSVDAQFGVSVKMAACSYTHDKLHLAGTMGASYSVSGTVDKLNLKLNMGAIFNQSHQNLAINQANVDLSMGVKANLCGAQNAQGNVSMGAEIVVGKKTETDNLKVSFGSKRSRESCQ